MATLLISSGRPPAAAPGVNTCVVTSKLEEMIAMPCAAEAQADVRFHVGPRGIFDSVHKWCDGKMKIPQTEAQCLGEQII